MIDLSVRRRCFAEEIEAVAAIKTAGIVEAIAAVPRERFLNPGPWLVRGEADLASGPRTTRDADPSHVYHNYSIAIDASRQLFNGAPGLLAGSIDKLALTRGARVLHVGAGLGYYTAIIAHTVGESGRVVAYEVDAELAARAHANLSMFPWVEVRAGNSTGPLDETFDAMLINAGVTHPQETWLDALAPGGRLILPLTVPMPEMGANIGKGIQVLITRKDDAAYAARMVTYVAIFGGVGLRDNALSEQLGRALMKAPFPPISRLRRDSHEPDADCWLHGSTCCLSLR
jgi:protein-L-isoaspartate(D-aspartate) O-methyltransferase